MATYTQADFQRAINAAIRAGWTGAFSKGDIVAAMDSALNRGLQNAWREGAGECSILPTEYTPDEKAALALMIYQQMSFVANLADAIVAGSKANGGKLGPLISRGQMWVLRYGEAKATGNAMACNNLKKEFFYGHTKTHCRSCRGLRGRVYRNSVWLANIIPPSKRCECGGWHCACKLETTDKPITKGRFPKSLLVN